MAEPASTHRILPPPHIGVLPLQLELIQLYGIPRPLAFRYSASLTAAQLAVLERKYRELGAAYSNYESAIVQEYPQLVEPMRRGGAPPAPSPSPLSLQTAQIFSIHISSLSRNHSLFPLLQTPIYLYTVPYYKLSLLN